MGASLVLPDAGGQSRTLQDRAALTKLHPVVLALNGVGGASSATLASMLSENGVIVTYGGMARQPVSVPTGTLIFKNIAARGFWLSKWLAKEKAAAAAAAAAVVVGEAAAGTPRWGSAR